MLPADSPDLSAPTMNLSLVYSGQLDIGVGWYQVRKPRRIRRLGADGAVNPFVGGVLFDHRRVLSSSSPSAAEATPWTDLLAFRGDFISGDSRVPGDGQLRLDFLAPLTRSRTIGFGEETSLADWYVPRSRVVAVKVSCQEQSGNKINRECLGSTPALNKDTPEHSMGKSKAKLREPVHPGIRCCNSFAETPLPQHHRLTARQPSCHRRFPHGKTP
ncbi:hypothetical protein B0T24DRAFT_354520 [Lasiosphaeria ovina]|uniref:Uncharacterized protein n=1 Tax=Lasiosphaeria ovina TaxID=92902 RepID=A0AAE0N3R7_9PEZI|nr:hypothetical protein B0T24DRAFT_354520 [Lasiosphaeria ovina]